MPKFYLIAFMLVLFLGIGNNSFAQYSFDSAGNQKREFCPDEDVYLINPAIGQDTIQIKWFLSKDNHTFCSGKNFPQNADSSSVKDSVVFSNLLPGYYYFALAVKYDGGFTDTTCNYFYVKSVKAFFTYTSPCVGQEIAFKDTMRSSSTNGLSFLWKFNGTDSITTRIVNKSFSKPDTIDVQLTIEDETGCKDSITTPVIIHALPEINMELSHDSAFCYGDTVTLAENSGLPNYQWSTGDTTSVINADTTGDFHLTVTDTNGCSNTSDTLHLQALVPPKPQVCMVTVDALLGKNVIVWEKENTGTISQYNIYRETNKADEYELAGTYDVTTLSSHTDPLSQPNQQANRYKISAVDTCGNESPLSDAHKTLHLTINAGLNNSWNLIWSPYEGFPYSTVNIWRGDSANMIKIGAVPSTNFSFTDFNPPPGNVIYQLEIEHPDGCTPTGKNEGLASVRSNFASPGTAIGVAETGDGASVNVFPNPAYGKLNLHYQFPGNDGSRFVIYDLQGRELMQTPLSADKGNAVIDISGLAPGAYVYAMFSGSRVLKNKLIIQ